MTTDSDQEKIVEYDKKAGDACRSAGIAEDELGKGVITVEYAVIRIGACILRVDATGIGSPESRINIKDGLRMAANTLAAMKR